MPVIFLISILLMASTTFAQNILVRAPGASPLTYELAVKSSPHNLALTEYQQRKVQDQPEQERRLFSLSDSLLANPELALLHLKGLQSEQPWTLNSLRFIRDLAEKMQFSPAMKDRKDLQNLYCKAAVILGESPFTANCAVQVVSLEKIHRQFPKAEKVMIESLTFSLQEAVHPQIAAQTSYHWTLLTNTGHPVSFFGTYEQLLRQSLTFTDYIQGTCEGFNADFDEMKLQLQAMIFFSESCLKKAAAVTEHASRWYQKKSTWWTAAGILLLGGAVYTLKDKTVTFTGGSLKF